ncbi:polysaccharide biosynthesis protein [bacterium]|nr:polysaccharide biosynthesis protein [bacterium]
MLNKNKILSKKTVVITGGTGSFGSSMVKFLQKSDISEIRIVSRDESKQDAMRRLLGDTRIKYYIGDVRDYSSLQKVFEGADFCFHAAALKHVPSTEFFPLEAVKTNIFGTENVLQASHEYGLSNIVLLSTDKAVQPVNAMGMSKGLMERVALASARTQSSGLTVCITRYGNVIASRGSVIPHFIGQAKNGKTLTISSPEMTRFVMSLSEAVDLVMHAFTNGKNGDLFIQKSPSATVQTIANVVNDLCGKPLDNFRLIGVRHGEKMFETLLSKEERSKAVENNNFFRVSMDDRSLDYDSFISDGDISRTKFEEYNSDSTTILGHDALKEVLLANSEVSKILIS